MYAICKRPYHSLVGCVYVFWAVCTCAQNLVLLQSLLTIICHMALKDAMMLLVLRVHDDDAKVHSLTHVTM